MSGEKPPRDGEAAFDVALDPEPKAEIIDVEEDEDDAARRAAILASTFDPEIARAGKSDEELIAERAAEARFMGDVVIAVGVIAALAHAEAENEGETGVTSDTAMASEQWDGPDTDALTPTDTDDGD